MTRHFRNIVWAHYKKSGRHDLPWRQTRDPYKILVSEIMLQQTPVERVVPLYKKFIKRFPTAETLASAPLSAALRHWQGLGLNRRAKLLREAARHLADAPSFFPRLNLGKRFNLGKNLERLEALPGVGPYTARAVAAFAFNRDGIVIETNIRTAVIHHFFPKRKKVSDKEIGEVLARALPKGEAREWYGALMDYGAYLKRAGISHNDKSRQYARQEKFSGSLREARGAVLRELAERPASRARLLRLLGAGRHAQLADALQKLLSEGLVRASGKNFALAD